MPTVDEVVAKATSKTKKRSVQLDVIDNALTVLSKFDQGKGSFYDDYVVNALYTNIFDKLKDDDIDTNIVPTSIYNIYNVLGATPRKKSKVIQENFMFYNEDTIGPLSEPKTFYLQAIFSMMHMINASVYIYKKLAIMGHKDMQGAMMKFLIVAASNAYDELYSNKGKITFAFYFKKALQHNSDLDTDLVEFKSTSWKSDFAKLTKYAKIGIDKMLEDGEHTKTIYIANLCLTIGKITDKRINPDEKRYTIEVGIADIKKDHYDRIFISTIKE